MIKMYNIHRVYDHYQIVQYSANMPDSSFKRQIENYFGQYELSRYPLYNFIFDTHKKTILLLNVFDGNTFRLSGEHAFYIPSLNRVSDKVIVESEFDYYIFDLADNYLGKKSEFKNGIIDDSLLKLSVYNLTSNRVNYKLGDRQVRYMRLAREISLWSKDPSTKIGALAVSKDDIILSQGYNGFPRNIKDDERLYNRAEKYRYIVHGEMNCIYNACHNGISLNGSTLYIYGLPACESCALGIIQVGIKRVVMCNTKNDPRWNESFLRTKELFDEAGIEYTFILEKDLSV